MKKLYSIGEVAKMKELTVKALRYYHKMGILIPCTIHEETGYRYYTIDQFVHIDIIKSCRMLGTSIQELQEIFKVSDTEQLLSFLALKRQEATKKIKQMETVIQQIDELSEQITHAKEVLSQEEWTIQTFEERMIVVEPCGNIGNLEELIYYSNLEKSMKKQSLPTTGESGIIYQLTAEGNFQPQAVFKIIPLQENLCLEAHIKKLPAGDYITIAYNKEEEELKIKKVADEIRSKGWLVDQVLEIELFYDLFNSSSYNCQIQIRINK